MVDIIGAMENHKSQKNKNEKNHKNEIKQVKKFVEDKASKIKDTKGLIFNLS